MIGARRLVLAIALATLAGGTVALAPARAQAQSGRLVVQMPFTGNASEELLHDVEDAARNALLARGLRGPDRSTVRGALGVAVPTDADTIVDFGRSMGATHVLSGQVTPLTGQFDLRLRLYEVSSGHMTEQERNVGEGEEETAIGQMLDALLAPAATTPGSSAPPGASGPSAAEQEAERRRREAQRAAEERRRREEAERTRRIYVYGEGGLATAGLGLWLGGVMTSFDHRDGQPAASPVFWGLRVEGGYALLPSIGFSVGGAFMFIGSPTNAAMFGASARFAWPTRHALPVRGSAGAILGLYQGFTGAQATSAWLGLDVRAEYDVIPAVTLFAGLSVDGFPGVMSALSGTLGASFRFGDRAPGATSRPTTVPSTSAPTTPSTSSPASAAPTTSGGATGSTGFGRTPNGPTDGTEVEVVGPNGSPP